MIRKIFIFLLLGISLITQAQTDSTNLIKLKSIQVIGIRSNEREPITQSKSSCDSIGFLNRQKDPFFILDKISPSIYAQSDNGQGNGYSYMRMRGLDQTRINFNLNGIPLNEMEDQGIYFSNIPGIYNYLSNISVQRGIGTSKYGNTSVAGSVNMETRDMSQKTFEINALALTSTIGNQYLNGFYSSGINKNGLALQVGTSYVNNVGFKEHSGNNGGSIFYSLGYYKTNNIFKIYGFSGLTHNQLAFYGVPMDSINTNYRKNMNLVTDKDTFNQNLVAFNWINYQKSNLKFNTSIYFDNVNGQYNSSGLLFGVNSYQCGLMSNAVYEPNNSSIYNFGFNTNIYQRSHFGYDSIGYYLPPFNLYKNKGYKEDITGYIKCIKIYDKFSFFGDIQLRSVWFNANMQNYKSNTYNWIFVNPKFGLVYTKPHYKFYVTGGYTQREPTRTDMIQNIVQTNKDIGANTDNTIFLRESGTLKPEKVFDLEIGNNYHSKSIDFNINGYLMSISNEFVANGQIDQYSGFMIKNMMEMTARTGVESDGKLKMKKFNLFYNFQYQFDRVFNEGYCERITFCPNIITSGGVSYKLKNLNFGLYEQYVGKMAMNLTPMTGWVNPNTINQIFSNDYSILNGFMDYRYQNLTISFKVNNLLNQKYFIPAGIGYNDSNMLYHNTPTYYTGQLKTWTISLKYKL